MKMCSYVSLFSPPPPPPPNSHSRTTASASPATILLHPLQLLSTPTSSVLVGNEQKVEYLLDLFCLSGVRVCPYGGVLLCFE